MRLITVMDNLPSNHKGLIAEHGLSFFIQTGTLRLFFDFGAGRSTVANARKLGIQIETTDYAVCSHGHYDHAGGYPYFVKHGLTCPLVTGHGFFQEKYERNGIVSTYLGTGFSETMLKQHNIEHQICEHILPLSRQCFVMSNFQRTHIFEHIPERFSIKNGNEWRCDPFNDEICLVIEEEKGTIVLVGCSHPGIVNILTSVYKQTGKPIYAVFGGTHLIEADALRIRESFRIMKELGLSVIGFNHCSGQLVQEIAAEYPDIASCYLGTGDCVDL